MSLPAVAFFGLGALGAPLAGHLAADGYAVQVHDPNPEALAQHLKRYPPSGLESEAPLIAITCVTDEAAAHALYFGPGRLVEKMPKDGLVIDHTTTSPAFARKAALALAERGAGLVDCPLSGGVGGAQNRCLLAMLGGAEADCARAQEVLRHYCQKMVSFGPAGNGQAAKLANQLAIAGTVRGLHEAARFARRSGLDPVTVFEALSAGSAQSAQMDQHATALTASDAAFSQRFGWINKDLELAIETSREAHWEPLLASWLLDLAARGEA